MSVFQFKQFVIRHQQAAMKVGTDSVLLGSLLSAGQKVEHILDVGTGSGLLAIMMAQRFAEARIDAVEIDGPAAQEAALNMAGCSWRERLFIHAVPFQQFYANTGEQYDLIVSNPPYYIAEANTPIDDVQRKTARHQSELSFADFLNGVNILLSPQGICWVILPAQEAELFRSEIDKAGLFLLHLIHIYPKQSKPYNRVILGFGKLGVNDVGVQSFCIYETNGSYTESYYQATRDFLLWTGRDINEV